MPPWHPHCFDLAVISAYFPQTTTGSIARGAASVLREPYRHWQDSVRLDNLDTEIVVLPSSGRIIRYGPTAGQNFLWENPKLSLSTTRSRRTSAKTASDWTNVGGDKAWPWPQAKWSSAIGREWPPPAELEQQPHELKVISRCVVELMSEPLPAFGIRVRRNIALAPHGNRLTVTTTLEPMLRSNGKSRRAPNALLHWTPWSIAQVPTPTRIAIRVNPSTHLPGGHKLLRHQPWESVRRMGDDILMARCPRTHEAKFGADGDIIAAEFGDYLLIQRRIDDADETAVSKTHAIPRHLPGEAVQVYASGTADDPSPGADYAELEFTGPRGQNTPSLTVQWDYLPWNPTTTDNELAAMLRGM